MEKLRSTSTRTDKANIVMFILAKGARAKLVRKFGGDNNSLDGTEYRYSYVRVVVVSPALRMSLPRVSVCVSLQLAN
jgi:hypothetical protein